MQFWKKRSTSNYHALVYQIDDFRQMKHGPPLEWKKFQSTLNFRKSTTGVEWQGTTATVEKDKTPNLSPLQELFIYSIIFIYLFDLFSLQVRSYH